MAFQRCDIKQTKNENEQNYEWHSNDEQSNEKTNYHRQNLGWHLNDVKLNKLTMKMNRTMNGVQLMNNLWNK